MQKDALWKTERGASRRVERTLAQEQRQNVLGGRSLTRSTTSVSAFKLTTLLSGHI